MAPIFYCKCFNCVCTATVLLTQNMQKQQEDKQDGEEAGQMEGQLNSTHGTDLVENKVPDAGHQAEHKKILPSGGQEYTYLVSGWDRPTNIPRIKQEEDDSGMESIFIMVVCVLILIGECSIKVYLDASTHHV